MATLKGTRLGFALAVWSFVQVVFAAPPIDVTQPTQQQKSQSLGGLQETDIVFTDPTLSSDRVAQKVATARKATLGRAETQINSRVVFRLPAGSKVQVNGVSKDGKWLDVFSLSHRKRGWIPRVHIAMQPELEKSLGLGADRAKP